MKEQFNFNNLIDDFSEGFILRKDVEGELSGGRWEEGGIQYYLCQGVILDLSEEELELYDAGGSYSTNDKKLRVKAPLKAEELEEDEQGDLEKLDLESEVEIEKGDIVFTDNKRYKVDRQNDRSKRGNYKNYIMIKQNVEKEVVELA